MKSHGLLVLAVFLLQLEPGFSQQELIKQRARQVTTQGSNRGTDPADTSTRPTPGATSKNSGTGAPPGQTAQPGLQRLVSDLAVIKSRSEATPELKQKLATDLTACAGGANKPAAESLTKLAGDLTSGLVGKKLTAQDQTTLARDLATLMNSANLAAIDVQPALREAQAMLKASGVTPEDIKTVAGDLTAVIGDLQKSAKPLAK